MSTVNDPIPVLDETSDRYFYGWRPVFSRLPDGSPHLENIPLSRLDILHPQEGDHIVQNTAHDRDAFYLRAVFRNRLLSDPEALVLHDCGVELGLEGVRMVCSDITVLFGVQNRDAVRGHFDTAMEGSRPSLIVEVVSPSTRRNDHEEKIDYYFRAKVAVYVILDRTHPEGPLTIQGLRWTAEGYESMELDERGRLWLDAVQLSIGVGDNRVVCYDEEKEIGDYSDITRQLIAAEAQAAEDRKARETAEAELAKAKAQLAELLARLASPPNGGPANPPVN